MADKKDPAVLFYTADFLASTVLWKDEEVGMYIKLLCIQHLQDGLTLEEIEEVCKGKAKVATKFHLCPDGLYRNPRMAKEKEKRSRYSESRRANISKRYEQRNSTYEEHMQNICSTSELHMGNENINENENINIIKDVIAWLNKCSGNDFDYTSKFVSSRVASCIERGYTYDDLIDVINFKFEEWAGTDMAKYLRPSTLFGDKFDEYLAEARKQERIEEREILARFNTFNPEAAFRAAITTTYGGEENVT